jgi:UDP-N-acetylmuramoyl-tripeptide--D-alanyl-D-alanine ligase
MTPITLHDICRATGAERLTAGAASVTSVCTDTRRLSRGCLFVALRGETFDGHDFLPQAAAAGAAAVLVDRKPRELEPGPHYLLVGHTRQALGHLAGYVRRGLKGKVVAVAGSNGKTGTKHLIGSALAARLRGSISPKSFNNDIGVPLTIFAAPADDDYLVLEIGTNHHGEIAPLAEIARPDIAVITNCSAEHLAGLTDLAGVRRENAQVTIGLPPDGLLVVNGDDPELLAAVSNWRGRRVTFGLHPGNDLQAVDISCGLDGTRFRLAGGPEIALPVLGRHAAINALAAVAVGRAMGLSDAQIAAGLAQATAPEMRLQLIRYAGVSVLNDAYNANPASMHAALATVRDLPARRRIAVLGDMRELGDWSEKLHREIGLAAAESRLDQLVCVGPAAAWIGQSAIGAGMAATSVRFEPDAAAAADVLSSATDGDLILLKGSRAMGLEKVAQALKAAG